MKVSAKQHIVLREPSLLDAIQTASLKWDHLTAKYYDSVDQVLKLRPYGLSWLLLYLESDPVKMEDDMERLTLSPDWRDLNWILFTKPAMAEEANELKSQFTQIRRVLILPCTAADLEQVYAELVDPNDPSPKVRAAEKKQSQGLPKTEKRAPVPVQSAPATIGAPLSSLPPPPRMGNGEPYVATSPAFTPIKMGSPVMPPPPQDLENFGKRLGGGVLVSKSGNLPPPPPATNGKPLAEKPIEEESVDTKKQNEQIIARKLPVSVAIQKLAGVDDCLEGVFKIFPNVSDYTILNSEAQVTRSNASDIAKTYSTESALGMEVCIKIGEDFGLGTPVEIHQTGQTKTCAFFSVNPESKTLAQFRSVQLLARRGSNLSSLAAYLHKTL